MGDDGEEESSGQAAVSLQPSSPTGSFPVQGLAQDPRGASREPLVRPICPFVLVKGSV